MHEPTAEDMAALVAQGNVTDYLLASSGITRKRAKPKPAVDDPDAEAARRPITSPLHQPGKWPFGVGPPGPNTCHPDCDCAIKPRPPGGQP
jgi:hypothetical protein